MRQKVMGLRMLGQRQVTPRWGNDPVWLYDRIRRDSGQGQVRAYPLDINQAEGGEGRSGLIRVKYLM